MLNQRRDAGRKGGKVGTTTYVEELTDKQREQRNQRRRDIKQASDKHRYRIQKDKVLASRYRIDRILISFCSRYDIFPLVSRLSLLHW